MDISSEMMDDIFDMMDGDEVEEGADSVVDQVLDELGVEMGDKMVSAPGNDLLAQLGIAEGGATEASGAGAGKQKAKALS